MKIVLALAPHSFEDRYNKSIAKAAGSLPPLGLLYLAAYLRREGHEVSVFDGSIDSFQSFAALIKEKKPDIFGVTAMTFLWQKSKKLIEYVKAELPEAFIMAGGAHPTFFAQGCFDDCPQLDCVVISEGELTLTELCKCLEEKKPLRDVDGIAFRGEDGTVRVNKPRGPIKNLDSIPHPARDLVNILAYKPALEQYKRLPVTNVMGSRGCPFQCIFCSHVTGDSIRFRSPENIIDEIASLIKDYGIREIAFWDDTMTVRKDRIYELCRLMKKNKLDIIWSAQARVNTVDLELLKEMRSAGCWRIFYGVESLIEKNLQVLKKGIIPEQTFTAVRAAQKAGIEVETSFIFGIPGETYEDALEDVERMIKLNPDYMKCFPLTPIPGTHLYNNAEKYGKFITRDLDKFTENKIVFIPHTMTEDELTRIIPYAYKKFYLRHKYILRYFMRIRSWEDIRRATRGLMAVGSL